MSSPKFNDITVVGCLLCYVEVFLSAYSNSASATHDISLCNVRVSHVNLFKFLFGTFSFFTNEIRSLPFSISFFI